MAPFQRSAVTLVGAAGKKINAITFQQLSGNLTMKGANPTAIEIILQMESMASSDAKLNVKLKGEDFFDARQFPTVTFRSDDIRPIKNSDSAVKSYTVNGEMNLKGKVIPITVPATLTLENNEVILALQLAVSKENWGKAFLEKPDDFFSNDVDVIAKLTFPKTPVIESKKKE